MKRLISLVLAAAMLICCSASAESFLEKSGNFVDWVSYNLGDSVYASSLFSDYYESIPGEAYIFGGDATDIAAYVRSDPRTGEIAYCSFATRSSAFLLLAMQCCSSASLIHLTDAMNKGGGYTSLDSDQAAAYEELLVWGDDAYIEALNALVDNREYLSPLVETDFFSAGMKVIRDGLGVSAVIGYYFGSPEEIEQWKKITNDAEASSAAPTQAPAAPKQPVYVDSVSGATPSDSGSYITYSDSMYVVNCQEWVSLRSSPSTMADRLAQVPFGAEVTDVQDAGNGFMRCNYNGITGYIRNQYLSYSREYSRVNNYSTPYKGTAEQSWPDDGGFWKMYPDYKAFKGSGYKVYSSTETVGDYLFSVGSRNYKVVNCDSFVTLREEANAYSDSILQVPKGATVQANGELNNWMLCRYEGRYGWIKAGYLKQK